MEVIVEAAVRSYQQQSILSLEQAVQKELLLLLIDTFIRIAKEIDDGEKNDTSFAVLEAYKEASPKQKAFLEGVLTKLEKPHNALEVIDVLEKWGIFSEHENIAIWKENLERRRAFNEEIQNAANNLIKGVQGRSMSIKGRTNLLHIRSFAIDKASTRDVDDAISYDPEKETVLVHIADPAEYFLVRKDHILVQEASVRILTIYSGEKKSSLFPENVSHDLFSLTGGIEGMNYATTYEFRILHDGEIDTNSMQMYSSVIAKPVCLTHRQAGNFLTNPSNSDHKVICKLYKLALLRQKWRLARGASAQAHSSRDNKPDEKARLLVDEMMITTNVVAAKLAKKKHVPILYRGVGGRHRFGSSSVSTFRGTRYSCSMHGTGTKNRDMEKGANVKLQTQPVRHATLGVDEYVQVTSPIRKYGDLIVNFQFNALLRGWNLPFGSRELKTMQKRILEMERVAGRVERRWKKYSSYQRLLREGTRMHPGVLRSKKGNERDGYTDQKAIEWKCVQRDRKEKWIVFLKDIGCDIVVPVRFAAKRGMDVFVVVKNVIPRTSYLDVQIWKA